MPTITFYNLKEEKKKAIISAVKKEFSRIDLIDMSVKNIVEDAHIARGSFYQYFESREDLIEYIISSEFEEEERVYLNLLKEYNNDIFEATYEFLYLLIEKQNKNPKYFVHLFQYLKATKILPLKSIEIKDISSYVNMDMLNVNTPEQIYAAIRIIATITFSKKLDILEGNVSKEEGMRQYKEELNVLKKGLIK